VSRKDKGRKSEKGKGKGKGKKRDRAKNEASMSKREAAPQAAPKVEAAEKVEAPKGARPRASRPRTTARPAATRRVAAPKAEPPGVERPPLPGDRPSLLALHQAARRQRDAAPLLSRERAEATFEIARIEVQIARVERAMDPPLG
jgi:hypothetical protein